MASMSPASNAPHPLWPLALFRILFGAMYLHMTLQKAPWVVTDGHRFGWLYGFLEKEIAHPTFGWYTALLQGVVLPNFTLFGALAFLTELALAIAFLFGILVPIAGLAGALWQVNIALGAYSVPGEWGWIWMLLIMPQIAFALCRAGRSVGLDGAIARLLAEQIVAGRKLPRWARYLA